MMPGMCMDLESPVRFLLDARDSFNGVEHLGLLGCVLTLAKTQEAQS